MNKADLISQRLQQMTQFIEKARQELQNGKVVDLAQVDTEVAQLCDSLLKLPAAEAAKVQPAMAAMISRLEELSVSLKEFQHNLKSRSGLQ